VDGQLTHYEIGIRTPGSGLTRPYEPLPVEGLVVDQTPPPGRKAHARSTITMHVWHPSQQLQQRA